MGNPLAWKGLKQPCIKKDSYILATTMNIWNPFWLLYMPDAIKFSRNADFEVNGHRRIIIMILMQSESMAEKPDGKKRGRLFWNIGMVGVFSFLLSFSFVAGFWLALSRSSIKIECLPFLPRKYRPTYSSAIFYLYFTYFRLKALIERLNTECLISKDKSLWLQLFNRWRRHFDLHQFRGLQSLGLSRNMNPNYRLLVLLIVTRILIQMNDNV